jgi:hypothetical protein
LNEAYRLFNQIDLDQNNYLSILIKTNNLNLVCGDFNSILNQIFIYLKRYNKIYTDEDGRFNFMREMVQIASVNVSGQIAGALKDSKKRDIVHLELVQKIIKSGKNEEALKLLSKMEKGERKEHALSEMAVEEYANDPNKTLFIIQNMDTNTFKLYTEARIVQKYFDINKKEEIISFSERILVDYKPAIESRNKYTNAALAMVFSALLKLGELQRARHIFSFIVHGKEEIKTSVRVRCFMKIYNYYNDSQNAEATNDELKNFIQELEDEASIKKTNQYIEDLIVELIKQGAIEKALNMYENITSSVDGATYYDLRSNKHSSEVRIVKALIEFAGESAAENFLNRFIATDIYTEVLSAYIMESIRLNGLDSLSRLSDKINECDLHSEISVCLGSKYAAENDLNTDIFQQIKSSMDFRFYNEFMVSFVGQVRMENLIRDKLIKILKMKISDPLVEALILQKYFIKGIFTDEIPLETIRRAEDVLRLKWALEMKEDIEM